MPFLRADFRLVFQFALATLIALGSAPHAWAQSTDVEAAADPASASGPAESDAQEPDPVAGSADVSERTRVAVLILATGELDPAMAEGLSEVLIGALAARGGLTIVGQEEFQAQLGQGDERTLACVSSMACLGRVGVQLDVVEVIAGTLAQREERWVFNLNRVDVREGEIVGRVFRETAGDLGAVADALSAAIPELYAPPEPPTPVVPPAPAAPPFGTLVLSTPVSGADVVIDDALVGHTANGGLRHELQPGEARVRVSAPGYHIWLRTVRVQAGGEVHIAVALDDAIEESAHPWVFVGGALTAVSLGIGIGLGVLSQETLLISDTQRMNGEVLRADLVAFYETRRNEAIAADVFFAIAGAAAISTGVALFFPERRRASGAVAIVPTPGGVLVRGSF